MSVFDNIANGMARGFAFGMMRFSPFCNPFFSPWCCNNNPLYMMPNSIMCGGFFPLMPPIQMPTFDMTPPPNIYQNFDFSYMEFPKFEPPKWTNNSWSSFDNNLFSDYKLEPPSIGDSFSKSDKTKEKEENKEKTSTVQKARKQTEQKEETVKMRNNTTISSKDSTRYDSLINKYSKEYGVDPNLVKALMKQESGFKQNAKSPVGAYGLMQLTADTAKDLGVDRYNVEDNIKGGTKYLSQLIKKFNGNIRLAIGAYNSGPYLSCYSRGELPNNKETRNHVAVVMNNYEQYSKA